MTQGARLTTTGHGDRATLEASPEHLCTPFHDVRKQQCSQTMQCQNRSTVRTLHDASEKKSRVRSPIEQDQDEVDGRQSRAPSASSPYWQLTLAEFVRQPPDHICTCMKRHQCHAVGFASVSID